MTTTEPSQEPSDDEVLERFVSLTTELQLANPTPWPTDPLAYLAELDAQDAASSMANSPAGRQLSDFLAANPQYEVVYLGQPTALPAGLHGRTKQRVPALLRTLCFAVRHGDLLMIAAALGGGFLLGRLS